MIFITRFDEILKIYFDNYKYCRTECHELAPI